MSELADQMLKIEVPPDLLIRANEAVSRAHEDEGEEQMDTMFVIFRELRGEADAAVIGAILFRLEALSRVVERDSAEGWTMTVAGTEYTLVNRAAFIAASRATLHERGNQFEFDPDEFKALALAAADAEGRG